ncbi:TonB-dependent receptor [uncultured Bacteroides sp.]|uniref:SusC/RagA family TonB-linked outer membrane protein n=1 Tax=uncultured Bacteroides sp. TaxID=162156 RepID=UPI002620913A|nr:TonB-dependent receptor [uncultured Bacteroides sp.]
MDLANLVRKAGVTLLMTMICLIAFAQNKTISGVIKDNTGEPLIGVSVQVKGTSVGSITDMDGNFTIPNVKTGSTLVVSYVGYATQELKVGNQTTYNITLEEDNKVLDEVVVIGYGTARKKDLTGAVSTVKGEQLAKVPVTNVAEALTGKLAGVQITTTDGSPDAEMIIKVRGGGSITGDNSPLYIVDGFPMSSMSDISPSDIEDITVLKDAASTAIYGSQGANGVILITTKSAKGGKTVVSYNGYIQGKTIRKKLDAMDPYQFVMYNYERQALRGASAISSFEQRYGAYGDLDLYKYQEGHDWQEEMFGNNELSQSHNISITGGNDKTKFTLSGTYANDKSLMEDNGYRRYNMNFKLKHELYKNLTLDFGARLADTETQGVGTGGGTYKIRSYDAIMKAPVFGLYDQIDIDPSTLPEDEYEEYVNATRSLKDQVNDYWRRKNERRYNFNAAINWKISKDFTYRAEGGYDYTFYQLKDWYGPRSNKAVQDGSELPLGEWTKKDSWKLRAAHTLTWRHNFNKTHDVNIMVGQEYVASGSEQNMMVGKFFQEDITPEKMFASMANNSKGTGAQTISSTLAQEDRTISFFGRANYTLMDRYLFTFTMRADGSSKFAEGNRWGYFPAGAVAWRLLEEPFMAPAKKFMSNLKLRFSYGTAGNNRIGSAMFETTYKAYSSSKYYGAGNEQNPHYTLNNAQLANPDLKWETTITRNVGLDFGFFNERLSGSIDYYWNSVKDLLIEIPITAIGYTTMQRNIGETSNKGIELTLNAAILQKKDYSLNFNFNIGFNKNRVEKLADGVDVMSFNSGAFSTDMRGQDDYRVIVGQPLGLVWGFVYDGIYGVDDFETYVDDAGKTQFKFDKSGNYILKEGVVDNTFTTAGSYGGLRPGAMKIKDLNGDGKIDADNDRTIIGKTQPKFSGGFGLNATYKWFDLSANFNFVYGNDVYNMDKMVASQSYRNQYANLRQEMAPVTLGGQAWTYLDQATGEIITDYETLKAMNATATRWSATTFSDNNPMPTSWAVEDGSFLRLQNLTLGFTLPKEWTKKFACNQFRLYCTLNNVFCLSGYDGYDPEVNSSIRGSKTSGLTPGADFSAYPKSFSWTAGVNITF